MSSKLTELTESSPSALPPSVLHGSGILSLFYSPSMAYSGHFYPTQIYDGYKAVEVIDPACIEFLANGKDCFENYNPRSSKCHYFFIGKKPCHHAGKQASNARRYLWSKKDGPFGKEFPVSETPTLDGTSGYSACRGMWQGGPIPVGGRPIYSSSEVPISRINTEGIVKRIRRIADSPPDPDAEGSDELDGKEVIPSTPRKFQPSLVTIPTFIPPASPHSSHTRPALNPAVRPYPIQQSRNSPIVNSQQLQPVASTSRRREELSPFPFPAAQVFQRRDQWPIRVTREDPNMASDNQDAVARLFRRIDNDSREVIMYSNDRTIPRTSSEDMAEKFAWYEDELINDFQKAFDYFGRAN
ncbi:hypothetical protein O181_034353 [Austropuccinia psidii MF-1]|uniref:Uncharacterized protein n=1 Tax=Austropuccinia psidii MF-1 TaxID=1389203 RepID=A0A9Q3D5A9_9BASI|nr:hypothetical protein [Austropuccinia psidii MF-1]